MADLAVHFAHHSFSATAKISEAWLFWAAREKEAGAAMSRRARFFFQCAQQSSWDIMPVAGCANRTLSELSNNHKHDSVQILGMSNSGLTRWAPAFRIWELFVNYLQRFTDVRMWRPQILVSHCNGPFASAGPHHRS